MILLLADVFEKFRDNSLKIHGLCLSHYLSATASSWDAILNMTKVELELISNADMYLFFNGVSYISKRYSKANNKYLKSYDQKTCNKAVNIYPSAIQFVPDRYKTQKMCVKAVDTCPFISDSVPD